MRACSFLGALLLAVSIAQTVNFSDDIVIPTDFSSKTLALDAAGNIIADTDIGVARVNQDGSLDSSVSVFSGGSISGGSILGVENSGTILAYDIWKIRRLNLERGEETLFTDNARTFALQPDGKIVLLQNNPANDPFRHTLTRVNPDGTPDPAFNPYRFDASGDSAIALQEDGKIIVGATRAGGIIRLEPNGSPDAGFNAPLLKLPRVNAMIAQPDGKILVAGYFQSAGETARYGLLRLEANGALDLTFNPVLFATSDVDFLALQTDGKIILSGQIPFIDGQATTNIARLHPNGALDTSFRPSFNQPRISIPLALMETGEVLAGFLQKLVLYDNPDPATQSFIRDGSTLTWMRGGSGPEIFHARFQASVDGVAWTDLGAGERIPGGWQLTGAAIPAGARVRARGYISGTSYHIDHVPGALALYSQPADRTVNVTSNVTFSVSAKGVEPFTYQWFWNGNPIPDSNSPSLVLSNVTGAEAGPYFAIVSNSEGSSTSRVAQLTVTDPILVAQPKSLWVNAGAATNLSVSAIGTGLAYQWKKNGSIIPGATSSVLEFSSATPEDTGDYQAIITGTYGALESAVVTVRVNTALPDLSFHPNWEATTQWFSIQTSVAHNNELYVGGLFQMLDSPHRDLMKIKADGSIDAQFAPVLAGDPVNGVVGMSLTPSGQLLIGGRFTTVNGQAQPHLARLNPDGSLDSGFRPVIAGLHNTNGYTQINSIETLADGRIVIAGNFTMVNGKDRPGLAILLPNGDLDESFNPDPAHVDGALWGAFAQPSGKVIAFGWIYRRFLPDGSADLDFTEAVTADSYNLYPLANGQIIINSQQGVAPPVLTPVDQDGNLIPSDLPTIADTAAQLANGELLVRQRGEITAIIHPGGGSVTYEQISYLSRYRPDGSEDPSFSPAFDSYVLVKGIRADGSMLVAGAFSNVVGFQLPRLALLNSGEPATQSLAFDGATATWLRAGTSPEVLRATFEFSSDGSTWTNLGPAVRIPGGWQLGGLQLPSTGFLRARGFSGGSIYDTTIELSTGIKLAVPGHVNIGSEIRIQATANSPTRVILQTSSDLQQWSNLQTNFFAGLLDLTIANQDAPRAFYRLVQADD